MNRFKEKVARFMQGRYGMDELGRMVMTATMVCMVLSLVFRSSILNLLTCAGLVYCYFRMLSRNVSARYAENQKYLTMRYRIIARRHDPNRIFKCPTCGQKVRVPKGKGKISIHCPKCSTDFVKRS